MAPCAGYGVRGIDWGEAQGNLGDDGSVVYLDGGGGSMGV